MIYQYDIFLSHATEDKIEIATPLYEALNQEYRVWYDQENIKWGDDLNTAIEEGLEKSKYGIVILSHNYLHKDKKWTWQELNAILVNGRVLPILHGIKIEDIQSHYPDAEALLRTRAISGSRLNYIIEQAKKAIGEDSLCSERNIDYTRLRNFLKDSKREEAAKETYAIIIQAIRQSSDAESINWEWDADFNTINRLWLKYTNGYFSKYDLKSWEPYAEEFKLAENEKVLIHTVADKQLYDIDKITVTGDKASEIEADYTKLRDFLKAKKFVEADRETARIIIWATRRESEGWLSEEEIDEFPCRDLRTINQLWLSASNGKFGLSAQKSLWIEVCKKSNHEPTTYKPDTWDKFINLVGWNDMNSVVFDKRAKLGHLPLGLYVKVTESRIKEKWVQKILEKGEEMEKRIVELEKELSYNKYIKSNLDDYGKDIFICESYDDDNFEEEDIFICKSLEGKVNDCSILIFRKKRIKIKISPYFSLISRADL